MRWLPYCCFFILALAACDLDSLNADGGADAGTLDLDGGTALLSGPLAFPDAGAREGHVLNANSGALLGYAFLIENHGFTCSQLESFGGGNIPATFTQVVGSVFGPSDGTGPSPGSFQVIPQQNFNTAQILYALRFPDGGATGPFAASDGQVTLTTSGDNELVGTFQATITDANGQASELTGSFDAPYCP